MDRKYVNHLCVSGLFLWCNFFRLNECLELTVKLGEPAEFHLPGIKTCGQYTLLNPSLRPVLIVEGRNTTNLIGTYDQRASVIETDHGFKLTLSRATATDAGEYKVASSSVGLAPPCVGETFYLNVIETTEAYLEPWGEWSFCISQCSIHRRRSRTRQCSLNGGCIGMGPTYQTETCDKAKHCPKWSSWGNWGDCSAKCGKGFKIRKRVCLSGNSSLVRSSECRGVSTQSHMCLTVCEVVGTWTEWSEWSICTQQCGSDVMIGGTRARSRTCSTDGQRLVTQNCTGNRTEEEACEKICTTMPSSTQNTTEAIFVGVSEAATGDSINIVSVIAGSACALLVLVILISVIVLKKRVHRRRESVPTLRPADSANNRRKKISKERKSGAPQNSSENESGNVYSEFNSNSFWPSSEFDSMYDLDNPGFPRPSLVNVMETIQDEEGNGDVSDGYDSEFDDSPEVTGRTTICERKEIIYEKARASCQRAIVDTEKVKNSDNRSTQSEDYVVTENECYEPPELWSNEDIRNSFEFDSMPPLDGDSYERNDINRVQANNETESMYYEPPVEDDFDDASKRAEMKRQESEMTEESVYENCEVNRGTLTEKQNHCAQDEDVDDYYEIPENRNANSSRISNSEFTKCECTDNDARDSENKLPGFTQVKMRNGSIVTIDERIAYLSNDDLDSDHIYVNGQVMSDVKDYYVTPKYTYGVVMQEIDTDNGHIYDIPKFSK